MNAPDPLATTSSSLHELWSPIEIRHIGGFGFPVDELVSNEISIAKLGRDSSLKIFFGPGRRVVLSDGTEWRIKGANSGRHIVPVIKSAAGSVAFAGPLYGKRIYGITGREFAYNLVPLGKVGIMTPGLWGIRDRQDEVGRLHQKAKRIEVTEPFPTAAALLAFTLVTHGIPGENDLLPR
ncbi:MAG: hypothetical protein HKN91_16615 [Acidimicrobiia bacterium]|nr:hypothetical protein [Acidimicrobiia bacterium]